MQSKDFLFFEQYTYRLTLLWKVEKYKIRRAEMQEKLSFIDEETVPSHRVAAV